MQANYTAKNCKVNGSVKKINPVWFKIVVFVKQTCLSKIIMISASQTRILGLANAKAHLTVIISYLSLLIGLEYNLFLSSIWFLIPRFS